MLFCSTLVTLIKKNSLERISPRIKLFFLIFYCNKLQEGLIIQNEENNRNNLAYSIPKKFLRRIIEKINIQITI